MAEQYQLFFVQRFKGKVLFDVPMSQYTSLGIGGAADVMAFPKDESDLKDLLSFANTKKFPLFILGGGTNLLVKDRGMDGIVVNMCEGFKDIVWAGDDGDTKVVVGAGVTLSLLLKRCKERGLSGLEFAAGIPGTVGGATIMNAGAYGSELSCVVEGVEVLNLKGKKSFISAKDVGFSYRGSSLPEGSVVIRVHMSFKAEEASVIEEKIKEFRAKRETTSPIKCPSAGSIFKNPEEGVAGRLIEEAGFKGVSVGDAEVSDVHANYIVNRGNAKAADVLGLMARIRDKVYSQTGISLEPEVKVVGRD